MNPPSTSEARSAFEDRFAIAQFDDDGVLLDLLSGAFYELNAVALHICSALNRGRSMPQVESELAASFGLSPKDAARDVAAVLKRLASASDPEPRGPIHFEPHAAGFFMLHQGRKVLQIDRQGSTVRLPHDAEVNAGDTAAYLQWVAPHLLMLQGRPVLHAAAVERSNGVVAFSGPTGAGKTTTARLFAAQGARLVCEDLLLVSFEGGLPFVHLDGEAAVRDWVNDKSALLMGSPDRTLEVSALAAVIRGPRVRLREILFLDRSQASENRLSIELQGPAAALLLMLENGFGEIGERRIWVDLLEAGANIVRAASVARAYLPEGLEPLQAAVRDYSSSWTW